MIDLATAINRVRVRPRASHLQRRVIQSCTGVELVLGSARVAGAQGCTTGNGNNAQCTAPFTIAMTVIKMTRLEIAPSSLTLLASGDATVPDYEAGFKTAGSLGLTAYTNNGTAPTPGVAVTMAAATTNFSYSGTASPTPAKAASTLQWSINSGGSWNNTTTAGGGAVSAGRTAGTNQTVIFRTDEVGPPIHPAPTRSRSTSPLRRHDEPTSFCWNGLCVCGAGSRRGPSERARAERAASAESRCHPHDEHRDDRRNVLSQRGHGHSKQPASQPV